MGIKIGFLTTLGVNVGDEFIREGIRHVLDQCGVPYAPFYVNKHDATTLSRPVEDEVCEARNKFWETDLFIQAGAPVYWRLGPHTSLTSEWYRWFWEELVFCQKPPGPQPVFVNLGAGATQPWGVGPEAFLEDTDCIEFARKAAERSVLTTVRDPCAMRVLAALGISAHVLPCPALLAAGRHPAGGPVKDLIGVNLMPLASHHDLSGNFDRARWRDTATAILGRLRAGSAVLFICHNEEELTFARQFSRPGERVFWSSEWRDYFDVYAHCEIVVANRVHGAVCAAGYGVPAIIIGNDTRAEIGDVIGLPRFHAVHLAVEAVVDMVQDLRKRRAEETARLLRLREETVQQYRDLLQPIIQRIASGRDDSSSFPTTRRRASGNDVAVEGSTYAAQHP